LKKALNSTKTTTKTTHNQTNIYTTKTIMPKAPRVRYSDQITERQREYIKRLCGEKGKKAPPSFDDISKKDASQLIETLLRNRSWPYGKSDVPAKPRPATRKQIDWLQSLCDQLGYEVPQEREYSTDMWSKDMSLLRRHLNINSVLASQDPCKILNSPKRQFKRSAGTRVIS